MVRDVPGLVLGEALRRAPDVLHTTQHRRQHFHHSLFSTRAEHTITRQHQGRARLGALHLKSTKPEPSGGTTPPNPAESNAEAAPPRSAARPCEPIAKFRPVQTKILGRKKGRVVGGPWPRGGGGDWRGRSRRRRGGSWLRRRRLPRPARGSGRGGGPR